MGTRSGMKYDRPKTGFTLEKIREAVEYVFRQKPREDAAKGEGHRIEVFEDETTLSFTIKGSSAPLTTGLGGFINFAEEGYIKGFFPIVFNGKVLNSYEEGRFWNWYEMIKAKHEERNNE